MLFWQIFSNVLCVSVIGDSNERGSDKLKSSLLINNILSTRIIITSKVEGPHPPLTVMTILLKGISVVAREIIKQRKSLNTTVSGWLIQ